MVRTSERLQINSFFIWWDDKCVWKAILNCRSIQKLAVDEQVKILVEIGCGMNGHENDQNKQMRMITLNTKAIHTLRMRWKRCLRIASNKKYILCIAIYWLTDRNRNESGGREKANCGSVVVAPVFVLKCSHAMNEISCGCVVIGFFLLSFRLFCILLSYALLLHLFLLGDCLFETNHHQESHKKLSSCWEDN